jgi:hypothetical protein
MYNTYIYIWIIFSPSLFPASFQVFATHDFNMFPFLGHQIVASQAAEVTHFGVQLAIHRVAIGDLCMTPPESDKNELTQTRVV